jgi:predicted exporter
MITRLRAHALPLALWLLSIAACVLVIVNTRFVADLSAFMPSAPNARQQMLMEQFKDGIIARLMMVGIEGATPAERARLSLALAARLRNSPEFAGVQNGEAATQERDRAWFFDQRYLLSPQVDAARFSAEGLRSAITNSLDTLSGDAGLMLKKLLPHDPTGETLALLEQFAGGSQPRMLEGAWSDPAGKRALLLLQTTAAGSDTDAQARAIASVRAAFESIPKRAAEARLVMSGTGVFSVSSRERIEGEISRLAIAGTVLVVGLLLAVYRSPRLLALGLLPVASGALAGIAAVSLGFGSVHGLTLAFGSTLIGEAVDYSIYLFMQRAGGSDPKQFWRIIRMGVLTSLTGFGALLCSGFPGLAQLGLYSIAGLVAAALVTRFVLPALLPDAIRITDLRRPGFVLDQLLIRAGRLRWAVIALLIAAVGLIASRGDAIWNRDLKALSPISAAEGQLDQELREGMGAPDMRYIAAFIAPDQEAALQGAEAAGRVLRTLQAEEKIGGFNSPALFLPSEAAQRARQAALPDEANLRAHLASALNDMPLRAERLEGFVADVQKQRTQGLLTRAALAGSSSALAVDSLLIKRASDYLVLLPLRASGKGANPYELNVESINAALAAPGLPALTVIDLLEESTSLFASYLHEALLLAGLGCLAIVLLLLAMLRSFSRTLRMVLPLACAVLCVTAGLLLTTGALTLLHLIGLLLVVAVGSNYALFFDSGAEQKSGAERRQTQVSLFVANFTTVGSFGLLGFSQVPILAAIGCTVGPGAFLALIFSAIFARRHA